jgi:hypothetical protein
VIFIIWEEVMTTSIVFFLALYIKVTCEQRDRLMVYQDQSLPNVTNYNENNFYYSKYTVRNLRIRTYNCSCLPKKLNSFNWNPFHKQIHD